MKTNTKYRIAASPNSWDIQEKRITQSGDNIGMETWVAIKFYGKMEQAAKSLLDILVKEDLKDGHSIQDVVDAIKAAEKSVVAAVNAIEIPSPTPTPETPVKTVHKAAREDLVLTLAEPSKKVGKKHRK